MWRGGRGRKTTPVTGPTGLREGVVWIYWVQQEHLYHDGCTPWNCAATRELCEEVLSWFDVPQDAS
jgi:hypothetical protein